MSKGLPNDETSEWNALSPVDGCDAAMVSNLRPYLSEFGLVKNRVRVEAAWLQLLIQTLPKVKPLSSKASNILKALISGESFTNADMAATKAHEAVTRHDVKAVELMLRDKFAGGPLAQYLELIHFGLTSEDVNNIANGLALKEARANVLLPLIKDVSDDLRQKAHAWANIPMLSRTHGQPATPTTVGKEFAVFADRIIGTSANLASVVIYGKLNGATGGYNAMAVAYPEVDWPAVSKQFVQSFGLTFKRATTQIEPHDWMAHYLHSLSEVGNPMSDLATDVWLYLSQDYFKQAAIKGEVGSSTMPHKVNPIDFEKAESNFYTSAGLADTLARKLTKSRLQRDLSDSSTKRAIGPAVGHFVVAITSLKKGLAKISPNEALIAQDLDNHWEVLTEPVQQVLRRYGVTGGYDKIKGVSRGVTFTQQDYIELIDSIADLIPTSAANQLRALTPAKYIGYAPQIALGQ